MIRALLCWLGFHAYGLITIRKLPHGTIVADVCHHCAHRNDL